MEVVTHNGAEGIALRDEETFKAKVEQWRGETATHQGVLEDLDPTGSALAQLFLYPVVRGEHWTLLRAQIRGDLLGNAVGEKTAYEACHSHKPRKLSGGRAGHRNGSAATPEGDLGMCLAAIKINSHTEDNFEPSAYNRDPLFSNVHGLEAGLDQWRDILARFRL